MKPSFFCKIAPEGPFGLDNFAGSLRPPPTEVSAYTLSKIFPAVSVDFAQELCSEGTKQDRPSESHSKSRSQPMGDNRSTASALYQTAEQFHILVDSVEEYAIYMLDPNGNVVTWNTGA
ncbi:MAG: hypothetical protein DME71_14200, partial [Verrucomicrobia bacterium]